MNKPLMTCSEFQEQLLATSSRVEVEQLADAHRHCTLAACRDAIASARVITEPLSRWAGASDEESWECDLAAGVLARQAQPVTSVPSRRHLVAALVTAAVAMVALVWTSDVFTSPESEPLLVESRSDAATLDAATDAVAVAYVERTEQWLSEVSQRPFDTTLDLRLPIDDSVDWLSSQLTPLTESLKQWREQSEPADESSST